MIGLPKGVSLSSGKTKRKPSKTAGPEWSVILLLSSLAALAGVAGQLAFDLMNYYSQGTVSGFLVSGIIIPVHRHLHIPGEFTFWAGFDTAIFLFRWISGAGAIALGLSIVLRDFRKALLYFLSGGMIGAVCWLAASFIAGAIPVSWRSPFFSPVLLKTFFPGLLTCTLLGAVFSRTRPFFFRFIIAGLLGGATGFLLTFIPPELTIYKLVGPESLSHSGLSGARTANSLFLMFSLALFSLAFIRKSK